MGLETGIEWTDATWNPVTGCTKVTAGCDHCYAATLAVRRLSHIYLRREPAVDSDENRSDPFAVRLWPERLDLPHRWAAPRMVFVNSMSDLFHQDVPDAFVLRIFETMLGTERHTYQILTKRPGRAARFWKRYGPAFGLSEVPPHIWMGTSVEAQEVGFRVRQIRMVPAAVRFLSCEPLLGPLTLDLDGIHWVIVGGESGGGRRPMRAEWAEAIRDQCVRASVPFFFKQWGGRTPKAGGRDLGGKVWDELPTSSTRRLRGSRVESSQRSSCRPPRDAT
jgi:protein gp37